MIRIHVIQTRGPGAARSQRIRVSRPDGQELTVRADEVRRTGLALLRAADRSDLRAALTRAGLPPEQLTLALGAAGTVKWRAWRESSGSRSEGGRARSGSSAAAAGC
ncbi:hypothetical protein GXW82_16835 [Streptacidiphilus sp. 4-A2]|nr:hypothetical protein [Streptacidiphilus sp. 4-A2]